MFKLRITNYKLRIDKKGQGARGKGQGQNNTRYEIGDMSVIPHLMRDPEYHRLDSCFRRNDKNHLPLTFNYLLSAIRYPLYAFLCFALLLGCGARPTDGTGDTASKDNGSASGTSTNNYYQSDADGDGASDACEAAMGTDPADATSIPEYCLDDESQYICSLYDMQKNQNELMENGLYNSTCGEEHIDTNDDGIDDDVETTCTSQQVPTKTDTLRNYGDLEAADIVPLDIELTYGIMDRDFIFIQNGIITIQPWYGYRENIKSAKATTYDLWNTRVGYTYRWRQFDHTTGAIASGGRDCNNLHKATVKVNGVSYNWGFPGFMPFRIVEYVNKYAYSTDSIQLTDKSGNIAKIEEPISVSNNFYDLTHAIGVTNNKYLPEENLGCQQVTVKFKLNYYKLKNVTTSPTNPNSLDEYCKDYLSQQ